MRKSEFLTLATAGLLASCSFYGYEAQQQEEIQERKNSVLVETQEETKLEPLTPIGNAPDFAAIKDVKQKKSAFFDYLRPGIAIENQRISGERKRLERIADNVANDLLTSNDWSDAKRLGRLYSVELTSEAMTDEWLDTMLHRVNVIPEALVLVQGANESAWGTSRFATQANNYFGQWCYSQGCGLIPLQRSEGMTHEVAKFNSVQQSIHGYFMNVNRNRAYESLREIRYQRQIAGKSLDDTAAAMALSDGLLKYSERGEAYVTDLQAMIRHNKIFWAKPIQ
jgi:Bax protein